MDAKGSSVGSSFFHAQCVIERKLDEARVMLKVPIMAFLKGIRNSATARSPAVSSCHDRANGDMSIQSQMRRTPGKGAII
jgi:hypothetical protein